MDPVELHEKYSALLAGDWEPDSGERKHILKLATSPLNNYYSPLLEVLSDMAGSIRHRGDLGGTRVRRAAGEDPLAQRRRALKATEWGYDPTAEDWQRAASILRLMSSDASYSVGRDEELQAIRDNEDSHRIWSIAGMAMESSRRDGHFRGTAPFRDSMAERVRRALGPRLREISRPPFNYDSEADDISRRKAVKDFITSHATRIEDGVASFLVSDTGNMDLLMIYQWDEDYSVSLLAHHHLSGGTGVQRLYFDWPLLWHQRKNLFHPSGFQPEDVYSRIAKLDLNREQKQFIAYGASPSPLVEKLDRLAK